MVKALKKKRINSHGKTETASNSSGDISLVTCSERHDEQVSPSKQMLEDLERRLIVEANEPSNIERWPLGWTLAVVVPLCIAVWYFIISAAFSG